jgi:hypothetical protein
VTDAQLVLHAPVAGLQAKVWHDEDVLTTHCPVPSHVLGVAIPPVHVEPQAVLVLA